MNKWFDNEWALVLGASSGMGLASAKAMASRGMNIFGVHFDRRAGIKALEPELETMKGYGVDLEYFNFNAADPEKRDEAIATMKERTGGKPLRTLLHSLAFGTLRRFFDESTDDEMQQKQMDMTLDVMAHSLIYWTQALRHAGLIASGSRILALTSAGSHTAWPNYGAVSAAKASLESHIRQIALELSPEGIRANAICAGVVDTPALRKIPGHEVLLEGARTRNPSKRLTTPEDIGKAVSLMSLPEAEWFNGGVLFCDGGEDCVG